MVPILFFVPDGKKVNYANFINDIRPLKAEKHRVRMIVEGDKLEFDDDPSSSAVSLLDTTNNDKQCHF